MLKVRAHTCYLGKTGYAAHSRSFFRELSKYVDLRVRNYTWDDDLSYINDIDLNICDKVTLNNQSGRVDYPISYSFPGYKWNNVNKPFEADVDIVLMETNHHYFYEIYNSKVKIAYTVWESTEIEPDFFKQLLKFDYLWVVSEWHRQVAIKQGYPEYRVMVVNEGVNEDCYNTLYKRVKSNNTEELDSDKFNFMFFGRWDYRKSVPEIVKSFLNSFPDNENVNLILSADNPYSVDGMKSTEERLDFYGLNDKRIKVKHFLSREEYLSFIKEGNVLITCSRSEGWNIPLIEALAAGTPVIYSDWGAQLEFASGLGTPVKIKGELPASIGYDLGYSGNTSGLYADPDFNDLELKMKECYENWNEKKKIALSDSKYIIDNYNWERIGKIGYETIMKLTDFEIPKPFREESIVIMSHADTEEKLSVLNRTLLSLKRRGYTVIISSHIQIPNSILKNCDYFICETDNPVIFEDEYHNLSDYVPIYYAKYPEFDINYSFDFNHGYAALRLIINGANISRSLGFKKTHFINYDYVIENDNLLTKYSRLLDNYHVVGSNWENGKSDINSINTGFFSAKNKELIDSLSEIKTKKDYFRYKDLVILEDVFLKCLQEFGLSITLFDFSDIQEGNIINSITIPAFQKKQVKGVGEALIFLSKERQTNKEYISILPISIDISGTIYVDSNKIEFSNKIGHFEFYEVSADSISKGIRVSIPSYGTDMVYNNDTKRVNVVINDMNIIKKLDTKSNYDVNINFLDGAFVEIKGSGDDKFKVDFVDKVNDYLVYSTTLGSNMWARPDKKYFIDWLIRITNLRTYEVTEYNLDLNGKRVYISLESKSLGDTIAWFPMIDEFRKKHNCKIIVSTFRNDMLSEQYPEIEFVSPGQFPNDVFAYYRVGWFYDGDVHNESMHPCSFRDKPMQQSASDILGLEHKTIKAKLSDNLGSRPIDSPYVCFGIHSTAQAKYWNNPTGWQDLYNYFKSMGKEVVVLSNEGNGYMGNFYPKGVLTVDGEKTIENAMRYLKYCDMFVGVGSGLSWLSWSMSKPTVLISGFSLPKSEIIDDNVIRVFKGGGCTGCFNRYRLDASDWKWCPDHKNTERQFECSKLITSSDVIKEIEKYWKLGKSEKSNEVIVQESYDLGMVQNHSEIIEATNFVRNLQIKSFIEIGTDQGGTFAIWSKVSDGDGFRISVDLPHGQFGRNDYNVNLRDIYLKSLGSNVYTIHGSSHDINVIDNVRNILSGEQVDFLFIDGDHTYDGVKQDYDMYLQFLKPGGWVGFHDIKDTEFHRSANCRVDILWNELKGNKIEFIDKSSKYGGIGFIQKNKD